MTPRIMIWLLIASLACPPSAFALRTAGVEEREPDRQALQASFTADLLTQRTHGPNLPAGTVLTAAGAEERAIIWPVHTEMLATVLAEFVVEQLIQLGASTPQSTMPLTITLGERDWRRTIQVAHWPLRRADYDDSVQALRGALVADTWPRLAVSAGTVWMLAVVREDLAFQCTISSLYPVDEDRVAAIVRRLTPQYGMPEPLHATLRAFLEGRATVGWENLVSQLAPHGTETSADPKADLIAAVLAEIKGLNRDDQLVLAGYLAKPTSQARQVTQLLLDAPGADAILDRADLLAGLAAGAEEAGQVARGMLARAGMDPEHGTLAKPLVEDMGDGRQRILVPVAHDRSPSELGEALFAHLGIVPDGISCRLLKEDRVTVLEWLSTATDGDTIFFDEAIVGEMRCSPSNCTIVSLG